MTEVVHVVDPRLEARAQVAGRFDVRLLEPAPPAVAEGPFFADDPVNDADGSELPVLAPVPLRGAASTWAELARDEPGLSEWCAARWLGAWHPLVLPADLDALARTRDSWHTLAEQVVAPARRRANGKIGLRFTRGGFGTPFFRADEQVRVAADGLVIVRAGGVLVHPITTVRAAADAVGIEPGAPADLYTPTTRFEPDAPLTIDVDSARFLGDWFGFTASVLEAWRASAPPDDDAGRMQLWPEHFDLSVELAAASGDGTDTYGLSSGDAAHPKPYAYVTPWTQPVGNFWNEGAYASLGSDAFADAPDQRRVVLDFFAQARAALHN
jgi:hypothetical protein